MTERLRVLLVDDESQIRRAVTHLLEPLHATVTAAVSGRDALTLAAAERPDLIILDLGLPDMDGTEVCRDLRKWSNAPVLVLTARDQDHDTIAALDAGADDFVSKPFSPAAFLARVRALLRRAGRSGERQSPVIATGELSIDLASRTVLREGRPVHLTPTEWELLVVLATHGGKVMTHRQLFTRVWQGREHGDAQAHLRVHIAHLRQKIEQDPVRPRHLQTEIGVGYRFVCD